MGPLEWLTQEIDRHNGGGKALEHPMGPAAVVAADVNVSLDNEFRQHEGFFRFFNAFQAPSVPVRRVAQLLGLVSTAATDRFPRPTLVTTSRSHHLEGSPR